jgi:hypothetical protein
MVHQKQKAALDNPDWAVLLEAACMLSIIIKSAKSARLK